jgi:hypothetical protein
MDGNLMFAAIPLATALIATAGWLLIAGRRLAGTRGADGATEAAGRFGWLTRPVPLAITLAAAGALGIIAALIAAGRGAGIELRGAMTAAAVVLPGLGLILALIAALLVSRRIVAARSVERSRLHDKLAGDRGFRAAAPKELRRLAGRISTLSRRLTLYRAITAGLAALTVAGITVAALLIVDKLLIATGVPVWAMIAMPVGVALLAVALVGVPGARVGPRRAAITADLALNLRERFATALGVTGGTDFEAAVHRDAVRQIDGARWNDVVGEHRPRGSVGFAVVGLAVVGLLFVPDGLQLFQPEATGQVRTRDRSIGDDLTVAVDYLSRERDLFRQIAAESGVEESELLLDEMQALEDELREMAEREQPMSEEELTEKLADLSDLQERAEKLREEMAALERDANRIGDKIEDQFDGDTPADKMAQALAENRFGDAADALSEMQDLMEQASKAPEGSKEREELEKKLDEARQKLDQLSDAMSDGSGLKNQLDQLRNQLQNMPPGAPPPPGMQQMMDQLRNMQTLDPATQRQMLDMLRQQLQQCENGMCQGGGGSGGQGGGQPGADKMPGPSNDELRRKLTQLQQGGGNGNGGGNGTGNGTGGDGRGRGGVVPEDPDAKHEFAPWLTHPELQPGDIADVIRRQGLPPTGGSARTMFERSTNRAVREAQDTVNLNEVPAEYRGGISRFFRGLRARVGVGADDDSGGGE